MRVKYSQIWKWEGISVVWSLLISNWIFGFFSPVIYASADLRPERVYLAEAKKTKAYVRDGLITGGDRAVDDVIIKDIRRATNAGFDRIVIDLEGIKNGEPAEIQHPPYFQIAVTPEERRLIFSIWGRPKLNFDPKKVLNSFKQSSIIQSVVLLPRLEDDSWTFVFELKDDAPVEVFELSNPVRVIMDIQYKKKKVSSQ